MYTSIMQGHQHVRISEDVTGGVDFAKYVQGDSLRLVVTVDPGVTVLGGGVARDGLYCSTTIVPAHSNVIIHNFGNIEGANGAGGVGASSTNASTPQVDATAGGRGGAAAKFNCPMTVHNQYGTMYGGGGGGGGGSKGDAAYLFNVLSAIPGGGGGGYHGGAIYPFVGNIGNYLVVEAQVGSTETNAPCSGGEGCKLLDTGTVFDDVFGGNGGACNGRGLSGSDGTNGTTIAAVAPNNAAAGGPAGYYLDSIGNGITIISGATTMYGGGQN